MVEESSQKQKSGSEIIYVAYSFGGAAATGIGVPASTFYGAQIFGIASTGVPLAELGGAALKNATLAFLGGGSIASGGGGMERGKKTLIIIGVVAALVAGSSIYLYFRNKKKKKLATQGVTSIPHPVHK